MALHRIGGVIVWTSHLLIGLIASPAGAQEADSAAIGHGSYNVTIGSPIINRLELATGTASLIIGSPIINRPAIATVTASGDVMIDWPQVEKTAHDQKSDGTLRRFSQIMLAVRDGTWKPTPPSIAAGQK